MDGTRFVKTDEEFLALTYKAIDELCDEQIRKVIANSLENPDLKASCEPFEKQIDTIHQKRELMRLGAQKGSQYTVYPPKRNIFLEHEFTHGIRKPASELPPFATAVHESLVHQEEKPKPATPTPNYGPLGVIGMSAMVMAGSLFDD